MKQETREEIVQRYQQSSCRHSAARQIAKELNMAPHRVKAIVQAHFAESSRRRVGYKIMKKRKHGLRLVRITAGHTTMDWYTDRDEQGIQRYVDAIASRLAGETM